MVIQHLLDSVQPWGPYLLMRKNHSFSRHSSLEVSLYVRFSLKGSSIKPCFLEGLPNLVYLISPPKFSYLWNQRKQLLLSYLGEGNGNPAQYSCLENPMDRRAW